MQNGECFLCGELLDLSIRRHTYGAVTWEHILPKILGGTDRRENLALSHVECNMKRSGSLSTDIVRPEPIRRSPFSIIGEHRQPSAFAKVEGLSPAAVACPVEANNGRTSE